MSYQSYTSVLNLSLEQSIKSDEHMDIGVNSYPLCTCSFHENVFYSQQDTPVQNR